MPEPVVVPANELPPVAQPAAPSAAQVRMETELAETRRMVTNLQNQMPKPQASSMDDLNRQFFKEPVSTATAIANQAANEAVQRMNQNNSPAHETLVMVVRDKVRDRNPELFDKYKDKIDLRVKTTVDPQFHSNIQVWEAAYNMTIGEHFNDIRDLERPANRAPAVKISEGGPGMPSNAAPAASASRETDLSPEERQMVKNLDISPEQYIAGRDAIDKQAKKGPSSWDPFVTFSSKDKRRKAHAARRAAAAK